MHAITQVIAELCAEADRYAEDDALISGEKLCRRLAARLEALHREWQLQLLTLTEAADETGRSYSSLQKAVSDGRIPNTGTKGQPRIRRCDLMRVPRLDGPDLAGALLRDSAIEW